MSTDNIALQIANLVKPIKQITNKIETIYVLAILLIIPLLFIEKYTYEDEVSGIIIVIRNFKEEDAREQAYERAFEDSSLKLIKVEEIL
jgi:hypothetical protein